MTTTDDEDRSRSLLATVSARPGAGQGRYVTSADGTQIYMEVSGSGAPLLFCHEFAGDIRAWDGQVAHFGSTRQCITYCARGYHPSEVPADLDQYSQAKAVEDAIAVLDAVGADRADVVGLSMGGYTALNLVTDHPTRVRSAVAAGCGFGSFADQREQFVAESEAFAAAIRERGMASLAEAYAHGPSRLRLKQKSLDAWTTFTQELAQHSSEGAALTNLGVQRNRPTIPELLRGLIAAARPVLVVTGDEDEACLDANLLLKRTVPLAGWSVLPLSGHTLNLEEPVLFNRVLTEFLETVEAGGWEARLAGSQSPSFSGSASGPARG